MILPLAHLIVPPTYTT